MRRHNTFLTAALIAVVLATAAAAQDFSISPAAWHYRLNLFQESDVNRLNDTPLNPQNRLIPQNRFGSFAGAGLFLAWRALTLNVRGSGTFAELRRPRYRMTLRELHLDQPLGDRLHLTFGRKLLKWGTGYAFNPTGVVEPRRDAADPGDRLLRNRGRQVAALDLFSGVSALSLVYANEAAFRNDRLHWGPDELAVRFYTFWRGADLSLIGHWQDGRKGRLGFNFAATRGSHLEFHGEFIAKRGSDKWYHRSLRRDTTTFFTDDPYERPYRASTRLFYRLLLGGQYSFSPGIDLILEYYTNRDGLTRDEWRRWRGFVTFHQENILAGDPHGLSRMNFYDALYTLSPEGSMRHYGFLRWSWVRTRFSVEAIALLNLVDGSGVLLQNLRRRFNSSFDIWLRFSHFFGGGSTEFGMLFIESSWRLGMGVYL